jgi:hypothetical protein
MARCTSGRENVDIIWIVFVLVYTMNNIWYALRAVNNTLCAPFEVKCLSNFFSRKAPVLSIIKAWSIPYEVFLQGICRNNMNSGMINALF